MRNKITLIQSIKTAIELRKDKIHELENTVNKAWQEPILLDDLIESINFNKGYIHACKEIIKMIEG